MSTVATFDSYYYYEQLNRYRTKPRKTDKTYKRRSPSRKRSRSSHRRSYHSSASSRDYERSYKPKRRRTSSPKNDDDEGHLIFKVGDTIGGKLYFETSPSDEIVEILGEGTFGKVVKCVKRGHKTPVAVKIVKSINRYRDAAKIEVKILQKLADQDPYNESGCIHMIDWFEHHRHICIVFQLMGLSVYDFMKRRNYKPFTVNAVRAISYQLLKSTRFVHDIKLTHTDLKPENMLFVNTLNPDIIEPEDGWESDISLIDFGSATFDHESHTGTVSTRHYRAPEVILDHEWSHACDLWSIGCIMFELLTGVTMFQTHSNFEHLCMMEHILGPLPHDMLQSSKKSKYFNSSYQVNIDWASSEGQFIIKSCKPLRDYQTNFSVELEQAFNLIEGLLQYNPKDRLTCSQALRHPFFDDYIIKRQSCR